MTSTSIYTSAIPVIQSKICNKCNILKHTSEFAKSKTTKDLLQYKCTTCDKEYRQANKDCIKAHRDMNKEYAKIHYHVNKEVEKEYKRVNKDNIAEYTKEHRQTNKEHYKKYSKEYKQVNKGTTNANTAKRRAAKLDATPNWAEFDLIKQLYKDCELISEMTGIKHHVDHIVPLQSNIVRGLHCIANLQILTEFENLSKSNLYWPDMP